MIVPMQKYSFLVFHKEYADFLKELQQIGVLHVIEKEAEISDDIREKYQTVSRIDKTIKFLEKRTTEEDVEQIDAGGVEIIEAVAQKQDELEALQQELDAAHKELLKVAPWGDFSAEMIDRLKAEELNLRFFITTERRFDDAYLSEYNTEIITKSGNEIYFIVIQQGDEELNVDAEEVKQPERTLSQLTARIREIETKIAAINSDFDRYATAIQQVKNEKDAVTAKLEYEKVILHTAAEADEKLMLLEGWVPKPDQPRIDAFLDENNVLYLTDEATTKDNIPVLLRNNRFGKLFEPIGKLFALPSYSELDLTVFFAPFFMLFFGFCLGDAGYGLLFVVGASLYKLKAKKEVKPYLSLIQLLGVATIIFGTVSGTLFGVNLIKTDIEILAEYKKLFLNPDKMSKLAVALGLLQIIFGMFLKAINQIRQFGFVYALSTFGWLIIILGGSIYAALIMLEVVAINKIIIYSILSAGGFFILFFSDPKINVFARIGKGVWDIYSTATGIFGDLLSYIRLFALGLSSAILGFVINDIALQILGVSPILGPVFFVVFLLLGHTLNILISSLGSFVHPMRLTFVEFYKNAGFVGGGKEYKPFSK